MTIMEFLLARIAEDERWADERMQGRFAPIPNETELPGTAARVFAECEAKRRIMEECRQDYEDALTSGDDTTSLSEAVLSALALPFADHPDYRDEWAS